VDSIASANVSIHDPPRLGTMSISKSAFLNPTGLLQLVVRLAAKLRRSSIAAVGRGEGCGLGVGPALVGCPRDLAGDNPPW